MIVYNVLVKGVENKITPFCKVFLTSEEAEKWVDNVCNSQEWRKCSSYASDDISDWRVEDKDGNTYYFVTYKQELHIEALEVKEAPVKFIDLHLAIISAVQKDIGCSFTEATEIVDSNETYLIDMIEGCGETNVEYLADVITTNDN